jgi:hypothetical protein
MELERRVVEAVRGAATTDHRERSIETRITRRVSDHPVAAIDSAGLGSRPAPSIPAPTFAPPSSTSRSAAQH